MAELAQLEAALVKADAAGDTEGARVLAGEVRKMRATKPSAADSIPKVIDYNPGVGVGETALALGSGAAGAVAGGISGLATAATNALGLTNTEPGDRVRQVQDAISYEPRTAAGRNLTGGAALPFELLAKGGKWLGDQAQDKTAGIFPNPQDRALLATGIETGTNMLPMALGPLARAIPAESAASIAARAKTKALNAPVDAGIAAARDAGLVITPTQAQAGVIPRTMESLSGGPRLEKAASKKNAPTINEMVRRDVGLPEDVPASREALQKIRADEGANYEFVKNTGRFGTDAKFKADLYEINRSFDTAAKDFAHRKDSPLKKTIEGLDIANMDAASAVEEVKLLRSDADSAYTKGEKQLGKAYKKLAEALDDQLDRHLQRISGAQADPALAEAVAKYRDARVRIAKTYAADKALNETTGNFDAGVYGKALKDGKKLSGEALKVGQFARQFPKSAQRVETAGATGPSFADAALGVLATAGGAVAHGAVGGGAALPLVLARPAARAAMLSGAGQDALTAPRTYGQSAARNLAELLAQIKASEGAAGIPIGQRNK